jgi:hypothetical protein
MYYITSNSWTYSKYNCTLSMDNVQLYLLYVHCSTVGCYIIHYGASKKIIFCIVMYIVCFFDAGVFRIYKRQWWFVWWATGFPWPSSGPLNLREEEEKSFYRCWNFIITFFLNLGLVKPKEEIWFETRMKKCLKMSFVYNSTNLWLIFMICPPPFYSISFVIEFFLHLARKTWC